MEDATRGVDASSIFFTLYMQILHIWKWLRTLESGILRVKRRSEKMVSQIEAPRFQNGVKDNQV